MNKNYKAIIVGLLIVTISSTVSLYVLNKNSNSSIGSIKWVSIFFAGFVTAFLANSHKLLLSISLALPTALIFAIANSIWQAIGNQSDFPGSNGFLIVIGMTLPLALVLSVLGGVTGYLTRRK